MDHVMTIRLKHCGEGSAIKAFTAVRKLLLESIEDIGPAEYDISHEGLKDVRSELWEEDDD